MVVTMSQDVSKARDVFLHGLSSNVSLVVSENDRKSSRVIVMVVVSW